MGFIGSVITNTMFLYVLWFGVLTANIPTVLVGGLGMWLTLDKASRREEETTGLRPRITPWP